MPKWSFELYVSIQVCLGSRSTLDHHIALSLNMWAQVLPVRGGSLNEATFILCWTTFSCHHVWQYIEAVTNEEIFIGGEAGDYTTTTVSHFSVGDLLKVSHHRLSEMSLRGLFYVPPYLSHTVLGSPMHRRIWKKQLLSKVLTRTTYCWWIAQLVKER